MKHIYIDWQNAEQPDPAPNCPKCNEQMRLDAVYVDDTIHAGKTKQAVYEVTVWKCDRDDKTVRIFEQLREM